MKLNSGHYHVIIFIALVLMGMLYGQLHSLQKEHDVRGVDLRRKDRRLKESIDSIRDLQKQVEIQEQFWIQRLKDRKDSLDQAHQLSVYWRQEYGKAKNNPAPQWSVPELDSIKRAILAHH